MKSTRSNSSAGGALVITVVTCGLIGFVLCSYLGLITNRNQAAMRATAWNTAIPVLEAGIEEAMTHLHEDAAHLADNNWAASVVNGQMVYSKERSLPDGTRYSVTISNITSTTPAIYATGYVPAPLRDSEYVSRVVRVSLTNPPSLFNYAIAANGQVNLNGDAMVDGYDSALGNYDAVTNRIANGGIATNSKQTRAIIVGTAHLYGKAVTGPGGTVDIAGGSVGDLNWSSGIEAGWTDNTMNVQFHNNAPPGGTITAISLASGTNLLGSGTYKLNSDFSSIDKTRPLIITGNATLWVTGNFNVTGTGYVKIENGASLQLYVGGRTASISGGGIVNANGSPTSMSYFGLATNTNVTYSGSANFVGTINAPHASVTLSGVNGGGATVYGAVICDTFTCTGASRVHYDQAVAGKTDLVVTGWREM